MSEHAARAAIGRMNLREGLVASHYAGLASDLMTMARADPEEAVAAFLARRGELCAAYGMPSGVQSKPFAFAEGTAIVPVHGTLINRFNASYGFVTGYNFLRSQVAAAGVDEDVKRILYDVNSYGGEAAGCFETAIGLKELANGKPTLAVVDSNCYSAAYAIACAADNIVCTPSGGAGSIGVVAMHIDLSKALDDMGIKVTFIHAGDHKVDGNPFEPLSAAVKADIQKGVNKSMDTFVGWVSQSREMEEKKVRATEARIYRAEEAMSLGLIDAVATPSAALQAFFGELSGSALQLKQEPIIMANEQKPGVDEAAVAQASATAAAEARTTERARISGIQGCDEAKGRESLASHLALKTDMSIEVAKSVLAAAPKIEEKAAPAKNPFKEAMDGGKHPNVGADGAGDDGGDKEPAHLRIIRAQEQLTGFKLVNSK